jgi:lipopolysaccharide/colanic/teichoic acid biosynthesis glycosyltransferase
MPVVPAGADPARTRPATLYAAIGQRLMDLVAAAAFLLVLSPLLVLFAVLIKLRSPGPVLYRGTRVGRYGVPFQLLKFRTMVVDADKRGPSSTADDDPRITPVGRFLRRHKLDELPQFLNVLRGEMSLVGPRPQVQWAVDLYQPAERLILSVRPGITDYASLRFRNENLILQGSSDPDGDYLRLIAPEKIRLGLAYVSRQSFATDVIILAATAGLMLGIEPDWCLPSPRKGSAA